MSKLYGTIDGAAKNQSTQRGHTELTTHAAGRRGAIRVKITAQADGTDSFAVELVPWKESGGFIRTLALGTLDANGIVVDGHAPMIVRGSARTINSKVK